MMETVILVPKYEKKKPNVHVASTVGIPEPTNCSPPNRKKIMTPTRSSAI